MQRISTSGVPCLLPAVFNGFLFFDCVQAAAYNGSLIEGCPTQVAGAGNSGTGGAPACTFGGFAGVPAGRRGKCSRGMVAEACP